METRDKKILLWTGVGIAAAALAVVVVSQLRKRRQPLDVVDFVDLEKYQGDWYEIARLPMKAEKDCYHSKASYFVNADGSLGIVNSCHEGSPEGPLKKVEAKAFVVDEETNARLKVQFKWPFRGDYQIIALGDNYQYAVVGTRDRKNLWILSREPQLSLEAMKEVTDKAAQQGFDIGNLIFIPQ